MNIKYKVTAIFSLCAITVFGKGNDNPDMLYFIGGNMRLKASFCLNTSGAGSGSGMMGGMLFQGSGNKSSAVLGNPADLSSLKATHFTIDSQMPFGNESLGINGSSILSESSIKDKIDSFLDDSTSFKFSKTSPRQDTKLKGLDLSTGRAFSSMCLAAPIGEDLVIGFGVTYPVSFSASGMLTDLSTSLRTKKTVGSNETNIDMLLSSSLSFEAGLDMSEYSFSLGAAVINDGNNRLSFGLAYDRYYLTNKIMLNFTPYSMIVLNDGAEYNFNDNSDKNIDFKNGQTNELYYKASGNYRSEQSGLRFGLDFESKTFLPGVKFSMLLNMMPKFVLTDDNAESKSFQPKFLKGKLSGSGNDALGTVIDSIDLAKPNLTQRTSNPFPKTVYIRIPSYIELGAEAAIGEHSLVLNYVKYMDAFSYAFNDYSLEKRPSAALKFGLDFKMPERMSGWNWLLIPVRLLYLDLDGMLFEAFASQTRYSNPHYRISGGLMYGGSSSVSGIGGDKGQKDLKDALLTPMPTGFYLSRQYCLLDRFTVGVMLAGVPDLLMKFSLGVQF